MSIVDKPSATSFSLPGVEAGLELQGPSISDYPLVKVLSLTSLHLRSRKRKAEILTHLSMSWASI